ncbi:MAG: hypothetical protein EPO65_07650 [Dehalococcoidia bacterium]|nr:MAG: hypothetical protein EPO65_07650 [Dehalococcoidia bacterium]
MSMWGTASVAENIAAMVDAAADAQRVPRNVLRAIVLEESGGNASVVVAEAIGGESVGLLQLYSGGQGAGMSIAERQDPARNLAVGTPKIAAAWAATAHLVGANRVRRTCALSGHPGDPEAMSPGATRVFAEQAIERIVARWQSLEAQTPDAAGASLAGVPADRIEDVTHRVIAWAKAHPVESLAAAAVLGVLAL